MAKKKPTPEILDTQPPRNLDAEKAVIGSILLVASVCDEIAAVVRPDDFYDDANRILLGHLMVLHEAGRRPDMTLLVDRLQKSGDMEPIGGAAYLAEVSRSVATATHAAHYAKIVRDASTQREMIAAGCDILQRGYVPTLDVDAELAKSEEVLFQVRDRRMATCERIDDVANVLIDSMALLDKRACGQEAIGLSTGFADLDKFVLLRPGELIIVAARPSMGKTALATNIALNVGLGQAKHVLFVSLEMSSEQLADRMLAAEAQIDSYALARGDLTESQRSAVVEAVSSVSQAKLTIDDSSCRTVTEIAAVARRQRRKGSLGLIIIDYLQLVTALDGRAPREQQVAQTSKAFKELARQMEVPVMVLAQLNRQAENTANQKPKLHHLRESGAIEQDADVVLFVHRPEYYLTREEAIDQKVKGIAEVLISKQRNGRTGEIKLTWNAAWTRFDNHATAAEDMQNYDPALAEFR